MTDPKFIDRAEELALLNLLTRKGSASLIVVRGRRRIGKSRLIQEFAKNKKFYSFAGIPPTKDSTPQSQRDLFALQLAQAIGPLKEPTNDWAYLFSMLAKETPKGEAIILFDEISWMGSKDPDFIGKLKNAWDLGFSKNPKLILIFCGSVSTWIDENIISSTAFFGRISLFLKLDELSLSGCRSLLHQKGFKRSIYEEFIILSITGGIPWYIEQIQPELSAHDNIRNLCFLPSGMLFNDFKAIFHDLFEKRSETYRPIVEVLTNGAMDFNEICKALNYSKSGTLSGYLNDLIKSGFITRDYTWSINTGRPSTASKYRLSDNYLRFYLRYIHSNKDRISRGNLKDQSLSELPNWNTIVGLQFENLVLKNRKKIWDKLGIRASDIISDNPYFQKPTKTKAGLQIDYLIQTRYNTLFACEIKFSMHPVSSRVVADMKEKLAKLTLPKRFSCWPVLIHVNGVSDQVMDDGYFAKTINFSEFLESAKEMACQN